MHSRRQRPFERVYLQLGRTRFVKKEKRKGEIRECLLRDEVHQPAKEVRTEEAHTCPATTARPGTMRDPCSRFQLWLMSTRFHLLPVATTTWETRRPPLTTILARLAKELRVEKTRQLITNSIHVGQHMGPQFFFC